MGCYDLVTARCPNCLEPFEFQSKADGGQLRSFSLDEAPPRIAADLDGKLVRCRCGAAIAVRTHVVAFLAEILGPLPEACPRCRSSLTRYPCSCGWEGEES